MSKNKDSQNPVKKPFYKRKWFIVLMVLLVAGTISNMINPPKDTAPKKSKKQTEEKTEKKTQKAKVDMGTASVESLTKLYKDQNKDKKKYKVTVDYVPSDNSCLVTIEDKDDYLTSTDFVRKQYTKYINYCKKAYKMSGLTSVQLDVSTTMSDTKGNENMEKVLSISMKKDVFDTYKWGKVKFNRQTIPAAIDAGEFEVNYIHPGVDKDVKWNKVYYEG